MSNVNNTFFLWWSGFEPRTLYVLCIVKHSLYYPHSYWFKSLSIHTFKIELTQSGETYIDFIQQKSEY
jgi:hypothetical protein